MTLPAGAKLGRYETRSQLGAGGMGEVYLAWDTQLDRQVAVKVLPAEIASDAKRMQRFKQEARSASALNHPHVAHIYEIGEERGINFIAMEFVEGTTLRQDLASSRMKLSEVLDVTLQVASALTAAHAAGIVHRDIKPENIMLRRDGYVKVLDFGLAKLIRDQSDSEASTLVHTDAGVVMGTPHYMSPEQARGLALDARTDIWSLGAVIYEMIGGRLPFEGATATDVIASILGREPIGLSQYSPEVPTELEWIVKKALRKDLEERYQTAKDLLNDLKNLKHRLEFEKDLESLPPATLSSGAQPTDATKAQATNISTSPADAQPWWRSQNAKLLFGGLALVLLIALGYFLLWATRDTKESTALKSATFTQLTDQPGPEFFPSLSPDGKSLVYASQVSGNWDIYLQRVGGKNPINLTKNSPADDTYPAFSPDGERIAFRSEREGGGIYLMGATGESIIRVSDFGYGPSWSPDGKYILVGTEKIPQPSTRPSKSQLWRIDIESGARQMISEGDVIQPNFSPHQQRIAYWSRASKAGQRESIWTIPAEGGEAVPVTNGATTDLNPVWSPDGKYLYFSSNRGGSTNIWRVRITEQSGTVPGEPEAVTTIGTATSALQLSISRDGRRLAYIAQEDIKNLRKVAFEPSTGKVNGEPVAITRGSMQLWFPDVSADGEWLTACSRGQQRHVYTMRTDGTDLRDLTDDEYRHDGWPRWSPDGKRIVFTSRRSGNYELWIINRDGSGLRQLTQANGAHYSPWSQGNAIAYSIHAPKNDCIIIEPDKTWHEQTPKYVAPLSDPVLSFEGWAWSPDGKKLAGIKHLTNGVHSGIGIYDLESKNYDWLTDFGDWPVWLNDNRRLLFVSQGKILLFDTTTRKYQLVLTVTSNDLDIGSPSVSSDNRMIYFTFVATEADVWLMSLE